MPTTSNSLVDRAADLLQRVLDGEAQAPVLAALPPDELAQRIDLQLRPEGSGLDAVVSELVRVAAHTPRTNGPYFFGQLFGGRDEAAVLAEILVSVLNVSMYTYKVAGPHVLIEQTLVEHMNRWVGFDNGDGTVHAGGSLSNLVAMLLARNEAFPYYRNEGSRGESPCIYTTNQAHYSMPKGAGILGMGRDAIRVVPTEPSGTMRVAELENCIERDLREGKQPVMIVANAGTTVQGAFDPIEEIADVAQRHGLWLHVDGAYGATVILSRKHRHLLDGIARGNSVTWNPHKLMGVPITCSVLLVKQKGLLKKHLNEPADYLVQTQEDDYNPATKSIHCARRNDSLKLWTAWKAHGDQGFAERVDYLFELAHWTAERIEMDEGLVLTEPPMSTNVCFEVPGKSSVDICDRLDRDGRIQVSHGFVRGRHVIRLALVNPLMEKADVEHLLREVKGVGSEL